jgi:hypothetical protein
VEDFDLIKPVALGFKEFPSLVVCGFHNRVGIVGKWNLGPVLLEQVLVDMEAGAEGFES